MGVGAPRRTTAPGAATEVAVIEDIRLAMNVKTEGTENHWVSLFTRISSASFVRQQVGARRNKVEPAPECSAP